MRNTTENWLQEMLNEEPLAVFDGIVLMGLVVFAFIEAVRWIFA